MNTYAIEHMAYTAADKVLNRVYGAWVADLKKLHRRYNGYTLWPPKFLKRSWPLSARLDHFPRCEQPRSLEPACSWLG